MAMIAYFSFNFGYQCRQRFTLHILWLMSLMMTTFFELEHMTWALRKSNFTWRCSEHCKFLVPCLTERISFTATTNITKLLGSGLLDMMRSTLNSSLLIYFHIRLPLLLRRFFILFEYANCFMFWFWSSCDIISIK